MPKPLMPLRVAVHGFTLIEVLVSLTILSLIALLSWRGVDTMVRSTEISQTHAQSAHRLSTALAQWDSDLNALLSDQPTPALDFDGRTLRITRRDPLPTSSARRVVAWTVRQTDAGPHWFRWQSPALHSVAELHQAWLSARQWASSPTAELMQLEVRVVRVSQWQIYYHRGEAWVNPQSSAADATASGTGSTAAATLPNAVRLVLQLDDAPLQWHGPLTKDWLRPAFTGKKS